MCLKFYQYNIKHNLRLLSFNFPAPAGKYFFDKKKLTGKERLVQAIPIGLIFKSKTYRANPIYKLYF